VKLLLANLLLAIIWYAGVGRGGVSELIFGFFVGYAVLWWLQPLLGSTHYFGKLPKAVAFMLFLMKELVESTLRVAYDVVTPAAHRHPGVIGIPLDAKSDVEIVTLATLVTLTPGSLGLDVSDDKTMLYIHTMFAEDPQQVRRHIKQGYEARILDLLRTPPSGASP
jgi:multicomponent Na+:H+ antiporter subunit E